MPVNWRDQRPDDAMVGSFDAYAPPLVKAVDAGPFREAMSRYGAAVHVITTDGQLSVLQLGTTKPNILNPPSPGLQTRPGEASK